MKLNILNQLPDGILSAKVEQLHSLLGGPTIINLKKEGKPYIFLSTLIHGNEHSGFISIQKILAQVESQQITLNYSILLFIGNTLAAKTHQRHLPNDPDFNRVWCDNDSSWGKVAQEVLYYVKGFDIKYNIDIHNSTGKNPFYTCVNRLDQSFLDLASYFSEHIVYFTEPKEVQSNAFSSICPSVTVEAGQSLQPDGLEMLNDRLIKLLSTDYSFRGHFDRHHHLVYHTLGRFVFDSLVSIDFDYNEKSKNDFSFYHDIDDYNLQIYEKGQVLGFVNSNQHYFKIMNQHQENIFNDFIEIKGNQMIIKRSFVPSLFSKDLQIIKSDCLGYLMEVYSL